MLCIKRSIFVLLWVCLAGADFTAAAEPIWEAMPLVTQAAKNAGHHGGEGGQAIRTLVLSEADPALLMMGTDVGGIYRSLDGGDHWQLCMSGWNARGGNAFAIDPKAPDRILGVGANSNDFGPPSNGVYLSTDRGASWKQVLPRNDGNEWRRDSLAFDRHSFDPVKGFCTIAYFESRDGGLFKSTDGGVSWACVNKDRSGANMKLHPDKGFVYLADNSYFGHGFYKSSDEGKTFRKINENYTLELDVISSRPDSVYIARWDKLLVSDDAGESFHPVGKNKGLPDAAPIQDIRVSPVDPKVMACRHGGKQWWEKYVYYSHDGGDSWHPVTYDNSQAFLPFTQADENCAFSPKDAQLVYSTCAGGWIVKSTDGGKNYAWRSEGYNAIMVGASFGFSRSHPDAVFLAFQDYAGAATLDGGKTWTFRNAAGNGWGGFDYGGYTVDGKTLWCGDAPSWSGPRTLKVSRDGGVTWQAIKNADNKPVMLGGSDVSSSDPMDEHIFFASNDRSDDAGQTWKLMNGCDGVYTASPDGKTLYGRHGKCVCSSVDHGLSWIDITTPLNGDIRDVAVDTAGRKCFVASDDRLHVFDNQAWVTIQTPVDQYNQTHLYTVAMDPSNPKLMYAGGPANLYASSATVIRSVDGGNSWSNLTANEPLKSFPGGYGPREVQWIRVHPVTHEAWASGECYGMWKLKIAPGGR
jgi:photosystem II stability/assembly factor-like uncharacterized protein